MCLVFSNVSQVRYFQNHLIDEKPEIQRSEETE